MTDRPLDRQDSEGEGFSARWSRRKTAERERAKDGELAATLDPAESQLKSAALTNTEPETEKDSEIEAEPGSEAETAPEIAPEDLPDVDSLGKDSDYTPFMQTGVPEWLRRKALRKLWLSDPLLANLDGLNDYDDDYSAIGMVAQEIVSRYKPGRGYLDDKEAEASAEDAPKEDSKEDIENISDAEEEPESDAAEADVEGAEIADNGADEIIEGDDAEGAEIADNGADEIIEGDNAEAAAVDDPSDNNI